MLLMASHCFSMGGNARLILLKHSRHSSFLSEAFSNGHGGTKFLYRLLKCSKIQREASIFTGISASLMTDPDDFEVGRFIGSYGFMNITSYSSFQSGLSGVGKFGELDLEYTQKDIEQLRVQDVGEGHVKIRLYEGRVAQGPRRGTRVIFKSLAWSNKNHGWASRLVPHLNNGILTVLVRVYPGQRAGGIEADMMAANELNSHSFLQGVSEDTCQNLQILLGGFETKTGEQWLAFRNDGKYSAAEYAKVASETVSKYRASGEWEFWNPFEWDLAIKRKRIFVIKLLRGALSGLSFMHDHGRLHQSLGPASIVLNTMVEKDVAYLVPQLRDLAFSVDIRFPSLESGPGPLSEALWRRAASAGSFTLMDKRTFGIADDIYEAGLLFAYFAFVPFCEAGIMDGPSLQRLFESTFQLNLEAAREYCQEDDRLLEAVKFLDLGNGAGWELLQAMLNPDFRQRPIAEAVLNHRFMTGAVL